jgi:hypothetical protein
MKRTITFEKSELSLYMQANNSIYSLLGHEKHENNDIPLNMNFLTFADKNLNKKLTNTLFVNQETSALSQGFKYNLTLFNIFHLWCLITLIVSTSVMYSKDQLTKRQLMLQMTLLMVIFTVSVVFVYSLFRVKQVTMYTREILAGVVAFMTFYLTFTDPRVFSNILNTQFTGGNTLIIGFYLVSLRKATMDDFRFLLFSVVFALVISLVFVLVFMDQSLPSGLQDFFILLGFFSIESFDVYQADLRVKHLFWRKEKEQVLEEVLVEDNSESSFTSLNTEIEVIIQSCDKIKKTIKTACDVIMYKDVKTKLKMAQVELERVKRRIATGSMMEVVKLEQHPNISENDKLFIFENFTDFSRNTNKRKSRLHESRVYPAPKFANEVAEFEGLMGSFGTIWNFDIWFVHQTTGSSIYVTAKYLMNKWLLATQLDLVQSTIDNYFLTLEHVILK